MTTQEIVSKLWNLCNVLRDDGITNTLTTVEKDNVVVEHKLNKDYFVDKALCDVGLCRNITDLIVDIQCDIYLLY